MSFQKRVCKKFFLTRRFWPKKPIFKFVWTGSQSIELQKLYNGLQYHFCHKTKVRGGMSSPTIFEADPATSFFDGIFSSNHKNDIEDHCTTFWALSIATFCSRFEILVIFTKIDHKGKSSTQIEVLASFFAHRDIFWCSKWWHTQFWPMLKVLYSTWRQPISANSTQIVLKSRWSLQCEYVFSNLTCAEFRPENDETSAEAQKHRKRGVNHLFLSTAKTEISQFWTFHQSIAKISGFRHARSL